MPSFSGTERGMENDTNLLAHRDTEEGNGMIFKNIKCIEGLLPGISDKDYRCLKCQ